MDFSVLTVKIAHLFRDGIFSFCPKVLVDVLKYVQFFLLQSLWPRKAKDPQFYIPHRKSYAFGRRLPELPRRSRPGQGSSRRARAARPVLPALVSGAHGLALDPPGPLLVGAVTDGALVCLHLSPGRDDSSLRKSSLGLKREAGCTDVWHLCISILQI